MKKNILLLVCVFCFQSSFSQNKRANIWYFGTLAGIDFNSGNAVSINNSAMSETEGCATMCDTGGNIMFYTNGSTVWDRTHTQMPNGTGLLGGSSSSMSSLIIPDPGNVNQYYIFTTASDATGGLTYSMIDMTLNIGNGDVTTLNTPLITPVGEKLTAFQKPGSNDIWVVTHEWGTANYYAYPVSSSGVGAPVISSVGLAHTGNAGNAIGYMKISPSGDKLALAQSRNNNFELFDFDALTGIVSNPVVLPATNFTYGIEFSRDGKILYAAEFNNKIYQFDLTLGTSAAIIASQLLVGVAMGVEIGSLQMAPDGKIYVAKNSSTFVGVINDPAVLGMGCNYVDNGFSIAPNEGIEGLPNFMASIFTEIPSMPVALFSAPHHICPGTCTNFTNLSIGATAYEWTFAGANPSVSTDANPTNICYNTPGNYLVQLIASNANDSDTLSLNNYINVYPYPPPQGISQSGDTLSANAGAVSYQWYHGGNIIAGATDYFYIATEGGDYNVVATDANGCEVEAAIFDVVAAVQSVSGSGQFAIYPNPVDDELKIRNDKLKIETISIYNVLGESMITVNQKTSGKKSETLVNVSILPKGIYTIEVTGGEKVFRDKFVKR